jgi:hypothetical protein
MRNGGRDSGPRELREEEGDDNCRLKMQNSKLKTREEGNSAGVTRANTIKHERGA